MKQISMTLVLLALGACAVDEPAMKSDEPSASMRAARGPRVSSSLVAGTRSLVVQTTVDASHCGGAAIAVHQTATPDDLDAEFVAAMTIESPTGLDFAADAAGARARFDTFIRDATTKAERASALLQSRISDPATAADARVAAVAREVQIVRRFADTIAHGEIPRDVGTGADAADKRNAYCNALATAAQPLFQRAELAATRCRELAISAPATTAGWWTSACAAR